jgi:type I restriction enzyme, R subunit
MFYFAQQAKKAMDKKQLTEADIISKFIMPAIIDAGWDTMTQIRQEVKLRDGKVIVRGQIGIRKKVKSADINNVKEPIH